MFNKLLKSKKSALEEKINLIEKSIEERTKYLEQINTQIEDKQRKLNEVTDNLFESDRKLDA